MHFMSQNGQTYIKNLAAFEYVFDHFGKFYIKGLTHTIPDAQDVVLLEEKLCQNYFCKQNFINV